MSTSINIEEPSYAHRRWNFPLFLIDYMLFGISINLLSPNSVVPDFMRRLTDDPRLIGLAGSLAMFCVLAPQLLFSQWVARRPRRKPMLYASIPFRALIIVLAVLVAVIGSTNPTAILISFLVFYAVFWIGDGLITILWADLVGSSLPPKLRATLFGLGQFGVALGAILAREVISRLLAPDAPIFPQNYAVLFGIAGVAFVISGIALTSIREEDAVTPLEPGPTMRQFAPYILRVLRTDQRFLYFSIVRMLLDFVTMAVPFYIIFGTDILRADSSTLVGDSILLVTFGNATISLINNQVSRRFGPRAVMWLIAASTVIMTSFSMLTIATSSLTALHICFFLLGGVSGSFAAGPFDYVITYADPSRRPIYIGLANTISAIGNAAPLIGGFILNQTRSFPVLFGISLVIAIIAALLSVRLADPRFVHGKVDVSTNALPTV